MIALGTRRTYNFDSLAVGFGFRPLILSGFLPGALVNRVQMVISALNSDGANKFIESGAIIWVK